MNANIVHPNGVSGVAGGIDPLLARLYHMRNKFEAQGDNDENRRRLCDDMTLVLKSTERQVEREMVADILLALLKKADSTLKQALSERLSVVSNVPLRLVLQMVGEGINVATPVLRYSDAFNDLDLLYIIQSRGADYWRVIAMREDLGDAVVDALVDTKDNTTVIKLIDNDSVTFTDYALHGIEDMAKGNSAFAEKALTIKDLPAELMQKLYAHVGRVIKQDIERELGVLPNNVTQEIDDVINEFASSITSNNSYSNLIPSAAMTRAAELFMSSGKLNPELMLRTLKRGQVASFVAQYAALSGLNIPEIIEMFGDNKRHKLAVTIKSMGFSRHNFIEIVTLVNNLSGKTPLTSGDISGAVKYFDAIKN